MDTKNIPGYGIDADPSRRPGVPEIRSPQPLPNAVYPPPIQQSKVRQLLQTRAHKTYPPVWGTAQPPKGLFGALRGLAYRYPDQLIRHWTMLLFVDRLEAWTRRFARSAPAVAGATALALWSRKTWRAQEA